MIVNVPLGERSYDIVIGRGLLASLGKRLGAAAAEARARHRHRLRPWRS